MDLNNILIIGYSGHAFVCIDNALLNKFNIIGYCEFSEKNFNPYNLKYLGKENDFINSNTTESVFVAIGENRIREKIVNQFLNNHLINLIHPKTIISTKVFVEPNSNININAGVTINPFAQINKGVILNTSCVIEHECVVDEFSHIAPGTVLTGNVKVGKRTFVGANSVIKQGVIIGDDVTIGAGSVIINDVPNGSTVVGNPGKIIKKQKV